MTKDEAEAAFRQLISQYGIKWTATVPREAHEQLTEINKVLIEKDRREVYAALVRP